VIPHLGAANTVRKFTCFDLSDTLELNDTVGPIYHKSAVYLVARGFEDVLGPGVAEAPVLGLEKYWHKPIPGITDEPLLTLLAGLNGQLIVSPSGSPVDSRTDARGHAALDNDGLTMTSVAMRALGKHDDFTPYLYQPNAPLLHPDDAPWGPSGPRDGAVGAAPPPAGQVVTGAPEAATGGLLTHPTDVVVEAEAPAGEAPVPLPMGRASVAEVAGAAPPTPPIAPRPERGVSPEIGVAPVTGSPILDVLASTGWDVPGATSKKGSGGRKRRARTPR
jgi:hypothetical protein